MKIILVLGVIVIMGAIAFVLLRSQSNEQSTGVSYKDISPAELDAMLTADESVFLLDVHIPEQTHIDGTDAFIPYNELDSHLAELPQDKNTPIAVYCRSGSMSRTASDKLLELGYTDVSNLVGGIQAWSSYQSS